MMNYIYLVAAPAMGNFHQGKFQIDQLLSLIFVYNIFICRIFHIKMSDQTESWEEIFPRGGKELDVRVVAHSAVYHSYSHSIIVYGGVVAGVARYVQF